MGGLRLVLLASWIGFLGGLVELLILGILKFGFDRTLWLGHHVIWMGPTMASALTALFAGFPSALVGQWNRRAGLIIALALGALLASWAALILIPGLHEKALLVLAAGLGVQVARVGSRSPERLWRLVRRSYPLMVGGAALLAGVDQGWRWWRERRLLAALPSAPDAAPNVLLLVWDTQRAPSLSLYGYERETSPRMAELAKTATVFNRAMSTSPWTLTGHLAMFAGIYPHQTAANWKRAFGGEVPTLAETLARRGYLTAGFVANTFYGGYEFGLDRGFLHYEDYVVSLEEWLLNSSLGRRLGNSGRIRRLTGYYDILARRRAPDINRQFLRWLDGRRGHPFFAFLNYFDVHAGYLPPPPYDDLYGTKKDRIHDRVAHRLRFWDLNQWAYKNLPRAAQIAERDGYDGAAAYLDREVGSLLHQLAVRGILDRTLVVVTSDHGEQFGEHGLFLHGNSLYLQNLHVPLLLRLPGRVPAGRRVDQPVSLRDLPATVLDLLGIGEPGLLPGTSLAGSWRTADGNAGSSPVFSSYVSSSDDTPSHSVVLDGLHYIRRVKDPTEQVFDIYRDPAETIDLAAGLDSLVMNRLRHALDSVLADSMIRRVPRSP